MPGYIWTPPKRNTEDPATPPLPGMPEKKPARTSPTKNRHLFWDAGNHEIWGTLAHPDLQEHNPFHKDGPDMADDWDGKTGAGWRSDYGGRHDLYEDNQLDPDEHGTYEANERHIRSSIHKALPAIAISTHALHKVLDSGRMKTQFETYTSGGSLDPESRADVENHFFGYPHDLHPSARPIYGYLTHNPSIQHDGASGYGSNTLILHRPRVWHRTSAFVGDTLDNRYEGHSTHPVQDFRMTGFPKHEDPREWRLDQSMSPTTDIGYTEAHYHGGVGLRDIHYAVLHKPENWNPIYDQDRLDRHEALKHKLNQHRIPWVEMDRGKPTHWEHHLSRLMVTTQKGAFMNEHTSKVIGQQGPGRYLIDLGYDDENGNRQAQIADTNTGELHPARSKDSILARGYWDDPEFPVEPGDILPHVTPK